MAQKKVTRLGYGASLLGLLQSRWFFVVQARLFSRVHADLYVVYSQPCQSMYMGGESAAHDDRALNLVGLYQIWEAAWRA